MMDRPSHPPRVVMVVRLFFPWIGGTERQAFKLASQLRGDGVPVQIVTGRWFKGSPRQEIVGTVPVFRNHTLWEFFGIKGARKLGGYLYILTLMWYLWRRRRTYDVIHVHGLNYHTSAAVAVARFLKRPVITKLANSGSGSDIEKMRRGQQLALSRFAVPIALRSDRFVALNEAIVRELRGVGVADEQIVRIPNGVEVPGDRAKPSYELHDPARLLFVGRLHRQKGLDTLLRSFRELLDQGTPSRITLQLIGDGPDEAFLVSLAAALGISAEVEFMGRRDDIERLLPHGDLFILPSRAEGLSNALLEAMSIGLPVVASCIPGNEEIIEHEWNGLLFTPDDATSLTSAALRLLAETGLRETLGRQARRTIQERYSLDHVSRCYRTLYEQLLRSPARELALSRRGG
jgi:glycosyltransferase involved in cell wall biosynthesis